MNSERKYDMQDKGERQRRLKYDRNKTEMNANRQIGRCSWTTRNSPALRWIVMKYDLIDGQKIMQSGIKKYRLTGARWLVQLFAP